MVSSSVRRDLFSLLGDTFVYGIPNIVQRFLSFLIVPLFTRHLSPEEFGVMGVITSFTSFLWNVLSLGADTAMQYYYYKEDNPEKVVSTYLWGFLVYAFFFFLLLFLFRDPVGAYLFSSVQYRRTFVFGLLCFFVNTGTTLALILLRLQRKRWHVLFLTLINLLVTLTFSLYFVVGKERGILGYYQGALIGASLTVIYPFFYLGRYLRYGVVFSFYGKFLRYGFPLFPGMLSAWGLLLMDRFFLQKLSTLSEVGLYGIAVSISGTLGIFIQAFKEAVTPFALSMEKHSPVSLTFQRLFLYYLVITTAGALFLTLFAPEALRLLTTPPFYPAEKVVLFTAFAQVGLGLYGVGAPGILLKEKTSLLSWVNFLSFIVLAVGNLLLTPHLGMMGTAISAFAGYFVHGGGALFFSRRVYPVPYEFLKGGVVLMSGFFLGGVGTLFYSFPFWIQTPLKGGIFLLYFLILSTLRIITKEKILSLKEDFQEAFFRRKKETL